MVVKLTTFLAFLIAAAWAVKDPNWESIVTAVATLAVFAGTFVVARRTSTGQKQKVSKNSVGVQAGRDVNIGGGVDQSDRKE